MAWCVGCLDHGFAVETTGEAILWLWTESSMATTEVAALTSTTVRGRRPGIHLPRPPKLAYQLSRTNHTARVLVSKATPPRR